MAERAPDWHPDWWPPHARPEPEPEYVQHIQVDPGWVFDPLGYWPEQFERHVRHPELGFFDLLRRALPAALGEGWTVEPDDGSGRRTVLCTDPRQGFVVSLVPTALRPAFRHLQPYAVTPPRAGDACAHAVKLLRWFHHPGAALSARILLRPTNRRMRNGIFGLRRVRHPEDALGGLQVHIASPGAYAWPRHAEARSNADRFAALTDAQHLVMRTIWAAKTLHRNDRSPRAAA